LTEQAGEVNGTAIADGDGTNSSTTNEVPVAENSTEKQVVLPSITEETLANGTMILSYGD